MLYTAFFWILVLAIVAGVVGGLFIGLNHGFTKDLNQRIRDIGSVVLIALPGLLILATCAVALCRDPVNEKQQPQSPVPSGVPTSAPVTRT